MIDDRRHYIGGSDIAAVLGISPWMTPYLLWEQKTDPQPELLDTDRDKRFSPRPQA